MGERLNVEKRFLKVDEESPLCVDWNGDSSPLEITTQSQLDNIGEFVFYKDLAHSRRIKSGDLMLLER